MQSTKTAIVWFTNNLRTYNNRALYNACLQYDKVIAVYCFDPNLYEETQFGFKKTAKYRAKFTLESVEELSNNLKKLNISLFLCYEHPSAFLPKFCLTYKADALFYQKEFTDEEEQIIQSVKSKLPEEITTHESYDQFLFDPEAIPFEIEKIPEVFMAFRKKVEKYGVVKEELLPITKPESNYIEVGTKLPALQDLGFQDFSMPIHAAFPYKGGENQAKNRLRDYFFKTKKLAFYKKTRNGLIGTDYSSKFSPWLANGCISAQTIYWEVKKFEKEYGSNQSTYWFVFELLWRDYFKYIALKHKNNLFKIEGIKKANYDWKDDLSSIERWIHGETDEPFVNANMIELKETGWMSNRGRQNVASYFSKELLLDWRIGAAYFESMLIDYDVHSNYGNWQYVAGVGNDPRDRKFNIKLQADKYDTNGNYQRLWLQPTLF
ncbi:DASH family cryptochrome [Tenacibaculum amylolyticum]|uniref:DASH family cryptochrome n=1 Tax=Tenacibaculum amylolyticum TaxID=104269 RepID=UPI003895B9F9